MQLPNAFNRVFSFSPRLHFKAVDNCDLSVDILITLRVPLLHILQTVYVAATEHVQRLPDKTRTIWFYPVFNYHLLTFTSLLVEQPVTVQSFHARFVVEPALKRVA